MENVNFKIGDKVYNEKYGEGVVVGIDQDTRYSVRVTFEDNIGTIHFLTTGEEFTPELLSINSRFKQSYITKVESDAVENPIELKDKEVVMPEINFKVGDRVYHPTHKYGTVVYIFNIEYSYPIEVLFDRYETRLTFTLEGANWTMEHLEAHSDYGYEQSYITKVEDEIVTEPEPISQPKPKKQKFSKEVKEKVGMLIAEIVPTVLTSEPHLCYYHTEYLFTNMIKTLRPDLQSPDALCKINMIKYNGWLIIKPAFKHNEQERAYTIAPTLKLNIKRNGGMVKTITNAEIKGLRDWLISFYEKSEVVE